MITITAAGDVQDIYVGNNFTRVSLKWSEWQGEEKGNVTVYMDFVAFGRTGESLAKVAKGAKLTVLGSRRPDARAFFPEGSEEPAARASIVIDRWSYVGFKPDTAPAEGDADEADEAPEEETAAPPARGRTAAAPARGAARPAPADETEGHVDPFQRPSKPAGVPAGRPGPRR